MIEITQYLIILGILCASNILLGIYYSVNVEEIDFNWGKMLNGIVKVLIVVFSCYGLTYAFCQLPQLSEALGIEPKAIMLTAIVTYASKVIDKLTKVLGIKTSNKDIEEELEEDEEEEEEE